MDIVDRMLHSEEPCIRYRTRTRVLGQDPSSESIRELREDIRNSSRGRCLAGREGDEDPLSHHPYSKWRGVHWRMASLADIGYPPGDRELEPWRERVIEWLLPHDGRPRRRPIICGRRRNCCSQEGNALYYLHALGLADERLEPLVEMLIQSQWDDGGWNCDKRPEAVNSSYHETLIPLRGLAAHARATGDEAASDAAERAADIFLKRRLLYRLRDGKLMDSRFAKLHYPPYWHYDFLFGLKVLAEADLIGDPRCSDALDLLESKRLRSGGWPAEARWYRTPCGRTKRGSGKEAVTWAPSGKRRTNEFVTVDALYVLRAAGRYGGIGSPAVLAGPRRRGYSAVPVPAGRPVASPRPMVRRLQKGTVTTWIPRHSRNPASNTGASPSGC